MLFDPDTGETRMMRSKEDAHDYRYFPDPDLAAADHLARLGRRTRAGMPNCRARTRTLHGGLRTIRLRRKRR